MWISDHSEKQLTSQLKKITAKELHRVKVGHAASNALIFHSNLGMVYRPERRNSHHFKS